GTQAVFAVYSQILEADYVKNLLIIGTEDAVWHEFGVSATEELLVNSTGDALIITQVPIFCDVSDCHANTRIVYPDKASVTLDMDQPITYIGGSQDGSMFVAETQYDNYHSCFSYEDCETQFSLWH